MFINHGWQPEVDVHFLCAVTLTNKMDSPSLVWAFTIWNYFFFMESQLNKCVHVYTKRENIWLPGTIPD